MVKKENEAEKAAAIAKAEADFQADMQKAIEKRDKVLAKYTTESLASQAWNAVKGDDDLPFNQCPPDVRAKLEYEADAVVDSGIANTNFEKKVAELAAE